MNFFISLFLMFSSLGMQPFSTVQSFGNAQAHDLELVDGPKHRGLDQTGGTSIIVITDDTHYKNVRAD